MHKSPFLLKSFSYLIIQHNFVLSSWKVIKIQKSNINLNALYKKFFTSYKFFFHFSIFQIFKEFHSRFISMKILCLIFKLFRFHPAKLFFSLNSGRTYAYYIFNSYFSIFKIIVYRNLALIMKTFYFVFISKKNLKRR